MSSDHDAEIRASVAAHADLGPGYDDAIAEGLVERIGAEIDKRIDARFGQSSAPLAPGASGSPGTPEAGGTGEPGSTGSPGPGAPVGYQGYQAPVGYQGYQAPVGYQGCMGGPMLPPGYQMGPPPSRPSPAGTHSVATTVTALGSLALGVVATAIVSHDNRPGAQALMVLLIWITIVVVNVAYARRP
jgi:hypothetical protein